MRQSKKVCKFGESIADIRIISKGKNTGEAIENSFSCFRDYVFDVEKLALFKKRDFITFNVENTNPEDIVHDIYSEIIYLIYTKLNIIGDISVKIDKIVTVKLERIYVPDFSRYVIGEVKAVTYHKLNCLKKANHVELDVTFDV